MRIIPEVITRYIAPHYEMYRLLNDANTPVSYVASIRLRHAGEILKNIGKTLGIATVGFLGGVALGPLGWIPLAILGALAGGTHITMPTSGSLAHQWFSCGAPIGVLIGGCLGFQQLNGNLEHFVWIIDPEYQARRAFHDDLRSIASKVIGTASVLFLVLGGAWITQRALIKPA